MMMKCGCSQNGSRKNNDGTWIEGCVIHSCYEPIETPSLENRKAKCSYGCKITESTTSLAFFRHQPQKEMDEYYCGCYGWD